MVPRRMGRLGQYDKVGTALDQGKIVVWALDLCVKRLYTGYRLIGEQT